MTECRMRAEPRNGFALVESKAEADTGHFKFFLENLMYNEILMACPAEKAFPGYSQSTERVKSVTKKCKETNATRKNKAQVRGKETLLLVTITSFIKKPTKRFTTIPTK